MPTARPRYTITETEPLEQALDDAALMWPALRNDRSALLRKLIDAGHTAVRSSVVDRSEVTRVRAAAGAATGAYPRGARAELLEEWPE